jgi:hypothetical protein
MYSFYELFAHYAKHLERYVSAIDPSEREHYCSEFHDVLVLGINSITQERYHSPSPDHILNGAQLEGMISPLINADKECREEHTLRHTLNRFNFPNYMNAPQPEDYPLEYEIYKQCFMLENGDLK